MKNTLKNMWAETIICILAVDTWSHRALIIAKPYERVGKDKDDMDNAEKELAKVRKVLENKDLLAQVKLLYISIFWNSKNIICFIF